MVDEEEEFVDGSDDDDEGFDGADDKDLQVVPRDDRREDTSIKFSQCKIIIMHCTICNFQFPIL